MPTTTPSTGLQLGFDTFGADMERAGDLVTINTAMVWTARASRGITVAELSRRLGVESALVHRWQAEDNAPCQITPAQLAVLSVVLGYPPAFFTHGNQARSWETHHEIARGIEISLGRPRRARKPTTET